MLYDARVNLLFVLCCHRIFNMCIKTNTILENFTFRVMMQMICQPDKNFCKQDSLSKELKGLRQHISALFVIKQTATYIYGRLL